MGALADGHPESLTVCFSNVSWPAASDIQNIRDATSCLIDQTALPLRHTSFYHG